MKVHELKTDPDGFAEIHNGFKKFELRFNDRDFKACDVLVLNETISSAREMKAGAYLVYTGKAMVCIVENVLKGPIYGLADGWVIMSIKVLWRGWTQHDDQTHA